MSYICSKKLNNKRNKNKRLSYGKRNNNNYTDGLFQVQGTSGDTKEIHIDIISGDMVMTNPIYFDANVEHNRNFNRFDGNATITADKFAALADLKSPYDIFDLDSLSEDLED